MFDKLALWLLCWDKAAQVQLMPECLCYVFKCLTTTIRGMYFLCSQTCSSLFHVQSRSSESHWACPKEPLPQWGGQTTLSVGSLEGYPEGISSIIASDIVSFFSLLFFFIRSMFIALLETPCWYFTCPAIHEVQPDRLAPSLFWFQNIFRKMLLCSPTRKFQPYLGHPHIYVLVLHRF